MAIPHRLPQRDNIRHHPLGLERPPVRPDPPKPDLHLVRDADPARVANQSAEHVGNINIFCY